MKQRHLVPAVVLMLLGTIFAAAQTDAVTLRDGVRADRRIDQIYREFAVAYRDLDTEKVANLYTADAAYLVPDQEILLGRDAVRANFRSFFDYLRDKKLTASITFDIVQRRIDRSMAYDVGIYTLRQFENGRETNSSSGKFVTVAVRDRDGRWRFRVDGYSMLKPPSR